MRKQNPKSYEYISSLLPEESSKMQKSRASAESIGLEAISLSAPEGQIIQFFVGLVGAKKVVEIGTLTGLSAQYILKALPTDGVLWTLEKSEQHAQLANEAIQDSRCRVIVGDAEQKLLELSSEGPFDAVFIDGNKAAYLRYYDWALNHVREGGLIVADNIFLAGAVWGDQTTQKFGAKQVEAVRAMNTKAFTDSNLNSMIIPTEEGLLITRKLVSK